MWCPNCEADVAAEVTADHRRVQCATCGGEITATAEFRTDSKTRQARELLERWSSQRLLDPYAPPASTAHAAIAAEDSLEPSIPPAAPAPRAKPTFRVDHAHPVGAERVELDPDESRLGPDVYTLTLAQLDHALGRRTAPVKAVLMDQARVAGLGNLLVDEAQWRAGIDPVRAPIDLDRDRRRRLHRAIRDTVRVLGRRGGSHTGDMPRGLDAVCPRDGTALQRRTVGGRSVSP